MRLLLTFLLLLAAPASLSSARAAPVRPAAIGHPTAATRVVLRVSSGGGFVTAQTNLRALPSFTLYGDGTVIVPGAVTQIYPGPAISPLVRSRLNERQVQALLRRAARAGLLVRGSIDYGTVAVSDMPTTTLLVNAAGRRVVRQAYALGATIGGNGPSGAQAVARRALARFIAGLPRGLSGSRYTPRAVAVYVGPSTGPARRGATRIAWPLERDLATAGTRVASGLGYRCMSVGGADAKLLLARLARANELSRWTTPAAPGKGYELVARPLLPDEASCASLGR